ncbi:MAG: glycosyltransferase family 4 protein [Sphingomonas sp.]|nr:glycosyltransferase family 4 protein [Sphingomonas sp.]
MALKIAMLTTFYPPYNFGGDGAGINRLSTGLADRGHEVTVIHDRDAYVALAGREPAPIPSDPRIKVIGLKSSLGKLSMLLTHQLGRPVTHARQLSDLLDGGSFDIIWFHNVSLIGGPGLLQYGNGLKLYEAHEHWLVCETHVLWQDGERPCEDRHCLSCTLRHRRPPQIWRRTGMLTREARHVDAFIAKSEFSRQKHRAFGFARDMEVIPYFLPDSASRAMSESPYPRPYFLFVGRLEKIKGVQDIIPAFGGANGPDLLIAGTGEYEQTLREQAEGHSRVTFLGRLAPEVLTAYYEHARALIVPSLCYETFGIIIIEAFRAGTPVLARRLGPFPEIIAKGGGLLFERADELRAAITTISSDGHYREKLSRAARKAFQENWADRIVLNRYFDLISRLARERGMNEVSAAAEASRT